MNIVDISDVVVTCADDVLLLEEISIVRIIDNGHGVLHLLPHGEGQALVTVERVGDAGIC